MVIRAPLSNSDGTFMPIRICEDRDEAVEYSTAHSDVICVYPGPSVITAVLVPEADDDSLEYDGTEQAPTWIYYDEDWMTIGGDVTATNAGDYETTFTPKPGYCWYDYSVSARALEWAIEKIAGASSASTTDVTVTASSSTADITVTRTGDGAISATSADTDVATATVSGSTVTVEGVGNGRTNVVIAVAEGTNWYAPANISVIVRSAMTGRTDEEIAQYAATANATLGGTDLGTFDSSVSELIRGGFFENFHPGDYFSVNGSDMQYIILECDAFYDKGANRHHLVVMHQYPGTAYSAAMAASSTTAGGYYNSPVRTYINSTLLPVYQAYFGAAHILPRTVRLSSSVDATNTTMSYTDSEEYAVPMTMHQLCGGSSSSASFPSMDLQWNADMDEYDEYSHRFAYFTLRVGSVSYQNNYYKLFTSVPSAITKSGVNYWLRDVASSTSFYSVYGDGGANVGVASNSRGVRPSFLIY